MHPPVTPSVWACKASMLMSLAVIETGDLLKQAELNNAAGLTVRRALEIYVQLADVIVHQVYLPVAHHSATNKAQAAVSASEASVTRNRQSQGLQFHDVHLPALARGRHVDPGSQVD